MRFGESRLATLSHLGCKYVGPGKWDCGHLDNIQGLCECIHCVTRASDGVMTSHQEASPQGA